MAIDNHHGLKLRFTAIDNHHGLKLRFRVIDNHHGLKLGLQIYRHTKRPEVRVRVRSFMQNRIFSENLDLPLGTRHANTTFSLRNPKSKTLKTLDQLQFTPNQMQ